MYICAEWKKKEPRMLFLVGDVGGTKTHLALCDENLVIQREKIFSSTSYSALSLIIKEFLEKEIIQAACFGVAGPIEEGICRATNLAWIVNAKELEKEFSIPHLFLINDLLANAYGLECLSKKELHTLNEGAQLKGNRALISAGTGLGEAGLYFDGKNYHPFASEGGHADFAPRDELEMEFFRYLKKKYTHVSYERVLSGLGLYELYQFLIDMQLEKESQEIKIEFLSKDKAAVVGEKGVKKENKACMRALKWFISLYGSEAGNLALKFYALGGVYIGGGIAPKILEAMKGETFLKAFTNKGRFASLLQQIPIHVVLNQNAALLGAALYAKKNG